MRVKWIDILKAIAIFFVVLGHTLNGGIYQIYIYSFHIALFFFISGYLFSYKESFKEFFLKKFKSLIIPYFCFGFISILIYKLLGTFAASILKRGGINANILINLKGLILGSSKTGLLKYNLPLWFLPCLFITNILFYLLYKIFKNKMIYLIPPILTIVSFVYNTYSTIKFLPWGLDTSFTMLVFFSLGYIFKLNQNKLKLNNYTKLLLMISFLLIGGYIGLKNGRVRYSLDIYHNYILFYSSSILSIFGYVILSKLIKENKILENVGKRTMTILVLHKLPIVFFQVFIFREYLKNNNILIALIVTIIVIIIMCVLDVLLTKYTPFLYGKWYKQNEK